MPPTGQHAVVIGGSMAGMLAARVLSDHFAQVTLLERDVYPETPGPRKGLPQAHHLHILLMRGQLALEHFFPGLVAELEQAGMHRLDHGCDIPVLTPAGWGVSFRSGVTMVIGTRDLLDWIVRRRVKALDRIRILDGVEATGLLATSDGSGLRGVKVHSRHPGGGAEDEMAADLVVDAAGRGSHVRQWLGTLGYPMPADTVINAHLGYASRLYRRPANFSTDWHGLVIHASPPGHKRGGVISPIEGQRWLVTLAGGGGDYPPTEEAAYLEFARSLRTPLLYEAIRDAEPLSPIYGYRGTENRRHHYAELRRWPARLMVLGDAVCAFNPVYGQGMTAAALAALALDRCLRREGVSFPSEECRRFQRELAREIDAPWLLATASDCQYPDMEGPRPGPAGRLAHWYVDQVVEVSTWSPQVRLRLLEVLHLLRRPSSLFAPPIAARVLWRSATGHKPSGDGRVAGPAPTGSAPPASGARGPGS